MTDDILLEGKPASIGIHWASGQITERKRMSNFHNTIYVNMNFNNATKVTGSFRFHF